MSRLVWDQVGSRVYETGLDKGVLYFDDCSAVVWNGLTSVVEHPDIESTPVYFDGMKIQDLASSGNFSATMKAVTYPDEFLELEGLTKLRRGVFVGEQSPGVFHLAYRTFVGDDLDGERAGYKIHILYNLTAVPSDVTYNTASDSPNLTEFEWTIQSVPEEITGHRPSAHLVIDSRHVDPWLMEDIEDKLYGSSFTEPCLPSISELVDFMVGWFRWKVIDLGDGSYELISGRGDDLIFSGTSLEIFHALHIYVVDHGDGSFTVYDTYDIGDIPEIHIVDNGDGSWSATTSFDGLFGVTSDGYFQIFNANAVMIAPDEYRLSDTIEP